MAASTGISLANSLYAASVRSEHNLIESHSFVAAALFCVVEASLLYLFCVNEARLAQMPPPCQPRASLRLRRCRQPLQQRLHSPCQILPLPI
jgi:hypothetical protein